MQSVSSRIWTRVNVSISYDDNHYTTGTSTVESPRIEELGKYIINERLWKSDRSIGLAVRVFANGPGDQGSIPGRVISDSKNGTWCFLAKYL